MSCSTLLWSAEQPDSLAVAKLYNTSWKLTEKYRISGIFHRKHRLENPSEVYLTIYRDEIHTSLASGKYQICASRHRNRNEFWLDCREMDQQIYRVIRIDGDVLVMDVLRRLAGEQEYRRATRNYYVRRKGE